MVGLSRLELLTSRLSGVCSNHLSYRPREPGRCRRAYRTRGLGALSPEDSRSVANRTSGEERETKTARIRRSGTTAGVRAGRLEG
jgi:hypothetical protein